MIIGAYTLDLYCDNLEKKESEYGNSDPTLHRYQEFPHQFVEHDRSAAFRAAKLEGWKIDRRKGICYCPKCAKEKRNE